MNTTRKIVLLLLVMLAISGMIWANGEDEAASAGGSDEVLVAYCSNGPYTFWTFASTGFCRTLFPLPLHW